MKPTRYELLEENGNVILRAYSPDAVQGYYNVEVVKTSGSKSLPGLRRHAEHLAKAHNVQLDNRLKG